MPKQPPKSKPARVNREKVNFSIRPETRDLMEKVMKEQPGINSIGAAVDWAFRVATEKGGE